MACIFRHFRSYLAPSANRVDDAVQLVHASGAVVLDGGGDPLRFTSPTDATRFADRFLCEPERFYVVDVSVGAAA
jgi:hypothetical protein